MTISRALLLIGIMLTPAVAGAAATASAAEITAIEHVNVIPMSSETILEDRTVLIRDERIVRICESAQSCTPKGARVIAGGGRYLMPALADMHNHIGGFSLDGRDSTRIRTRNQIFRLYVMFGVAVVRDPAGDPALLEARDQVNRGELFGPRIFSAWGVMDGDPPLFRGTRSFSSAPAAADFVRDTARRGFDLVKVYSTLSPPVFDAVLETANQAGLSVAAHVPIEVPLQHALDKGLRSIEHLTGYDVACAAPNVGMRPNMQDIYQGWAWCTPPKIQELATLTARYPVWNVPTLTLWDDTVTEFNRANRNAGETGVYEHPATVLGIDRFYALLGPRERAGIAGTRDVRLAFVKALSQAGAPLLIGTDTSAPGYTVHRELAAFVEAGLTPYQALRAATVEPARYLRMEGEFGVIAPRARAEVLLMDANPLIDIRNARKLHGLMHRGRWWSQSEIEAELQAVLQEYAEDAASMHLQSRSEQSAAAQNAQQKSPQKSPPIGSPSPETNTALGKYIELCSACHGRRMEGGLGPSLIDDIWLHGSDEDSIAGSISSGFPEKGMPAWGTSLSPVQIRSLVVLIHEMRAEAQGNVRAIHDRDDVARPLPQGVQHSRDHEFRVESFLEGLGGMPYSFVFASKSRIFLTEKSNAQLRIIENGRLLPDPVAGTPATHRHPDGSGALLSVVVHPDYEHNGWVYLAFADDPAARVDNPAPSGGPASGGPASAGDVRASSQPPMSSLVSVVRGRIVGNRWTDQQLIWQAADDLRVSTPDSDAFFAGRLAFDRQARLYFSIGVPDLARQEAQDLSLPRGKIFRVLDEGGIPKDNPFVHDLHAVPGIFTYGHRNPQGLALDPLTGNVWSTEHGPRGGDELNLILRGRNYGWPLVTFGMSYDGTPISERTTGEGLEPPVLQWTPSIAISNLAFYKGRAFPRWRHSLFIGSLKAEELLRVEFHGAKTAAVERILKDIGRIRDLQIGPDGYPYLLIESLGSGNQGRIIRLVPTGGRVHRRRGTAVFQER